MSAGSADLTALAADLNQAGRAMSDFTANLVGDTARTVEQIAKSMAPVDTGDLKNSIAVRFENALTAIIGPGVEYGTYQEFGTGSRGEFNGQAYEIKPKAGGVLAFRVNGRLVITRKPVMHPGVKAQPYMRPALLQALQPFTDTLLEAGVLAITKGPRSVL